MSAFCDCSFTQVFKQKLLERVSIVIQILHGSRAFTALPIIAGSPVFVYTSFLLCKLQYPAGLIGAG